jgi:hypothetical protein
MTRDEAFTKFKEAILKGFRRSNPKYAWSQHDTGNAYASIELCESLGLVQIEEPAPPSPKPTAHEVIRSVVMLPYHFPDDMADDVLSKLDKQGYVVARRGSPDNNCLGVIARSIQNMGGVRNLLANSGAHDIAADLLVKDLIAGGFDIVGLTPAPRLPDEVFAEGFADCSASYSNDVHWFPEKAPRFVPRESVHACIAEALRQRLIRDSVDYATTKILEMLDSRNIGFKWGADR